MKHTALCSLLVLAAACGGDSSSESNPNPTPDPRAEHNAMLEGLGVDTNVGRRKDPAHNEVPDGYNPLGRSRRQLQKRSELFFAGTRGQSADTWITPTGKDGGGLNWADAATVFSTSGNVVGDDDFLQLHKAMAAGDVDGDGRDEVVVVYLRASTLPGKNQELALAVLEHDAAIPGFTIAWQRAIPGAAYANAEITEYPADYYWPINFNASCGDVDGNGQVETLLAFNGTLFLLGDSAKDFGLMKTIAFPKTGDTALRVLRTAAGELTGDGADEFVVAVTSLKAGARTGSAAYQIYSGVTLASIASGPLAVTESATTATMRSGNVAVGDVDADGLNEVFFTGLKENSADLYMFILDTFWDAAAGSLRYEFIPDFNVVATRSDLLQAQSTFIADFDGDRRSELLAYRNIYEVSISGSGAGATMSWTFKQDALAGGIASAWDTVTAVGDVDGDLKDDFISMSDSWWELQCHGYSSLGTWGLKDTIDIWDSGVYFPGLAVGDFDGDSIVLEYVASETLFTQPHPIAVVASNPFWAGIPMTGSTSFGTMSGGEVSTERSMGVSVGASVGYETEGLFDLWKAEFKVSVEAAFDWTATNTRSYEESYTYTTFDEDMVVFTAVPYDVYYYRVVASPNAAMIDQAITVSLPRRPITIPVERGFYNANNGNAPDIDAGVLTHTVGEPYSYPTPDHAAVLVAGGGGSGIMSSETRTVGAGGNETSIDMSVVDATGTGTAFDIGVTVEAEVGAGGWTVGVSAGYHYGEAYSVTTSTGMLYGGTVGGIPVANYSPTLSFNWGLFSYRGMLGAEKFMVVQYYVEPAP